MLGTAPFFDGPFVFRLDVLLRPTALFILLFSLLSFQKFDDTLSSIWYSDTKTWEGLLGCRNSVDNIYNNG